MMRLYRIYYSLIFLFVLTGTEVFAQVTPPASATGHVIAEIIPVFSASETSQLNFGRFSPGPQGGKIILTPQSTISVLGSVFKGPGTHNAASFYISGDDDAAYSITLPASPVIITHTASAKTMLVDNWSSVPSPGIGTGMLQGGYQVVYVGATLNVGTLYDNPVGIYTGTYTITFDFN
ncbi:MAG: DUF4402 domain-containing protein [Bacteroidales bacterium]|nr:DUF4402 domain-containing protein [Bacteroidales bacterium]